MKRRRKPNHSWPVNWAVVVVAALLTLGIGIVVVSLSASDQSGGIVVPTQTSAPPPVFLTTRP
ncbi:MAG: hypothetical protein ABW215_07125 [Kibdelosporangium sp.]